MKFHSPSINIVLKYKRPDKRPYPKELNTYGDHLRKKRLDLNLSQPEVAKILNVTTDTITNWELNRNIPELSHIPKIISFLGYSPEITENPVKAYRINHGLTQKELAIILDIDPTTLAKIENGRVVKMKNRTREQINKLI